MCRCPAEDRPQRPGRIVFAVLRVRSRREARAFIGFKHVNGAFKWDALAKAKFAADWYGEEQNIEAIARRLGDTHLHGCAPRQRLERPAARVRDLGFDMEQRSSGRFRAIPSLHRIGETHAVRAYLGLQERTPKRQASAPATPVPASHRQQLLRLHVVALWARE